MKTIPLTQGYFAVIDDSDYRLVSQYKWQVLRCRHMRYAVHSYWDGKKYHKLMMHHLILGVPKSDIVDHRDGNGLNNRRKNIRPASDSQNQQNKKRAFVGKSKYRGVTATASTFRARISKDRKRIDLGRFRQEADAAAAYDAAARSMFGEFAWTNSDQYPKDGIK